MALFGAIEIYSQQFTYTYDASGNRIKREYSLIQNPGGIEENEESNFNSSISLNAYPNPIQDKLTIELISSEPLDESYRVLLYTETGQFLKEFQLTQHKKTINTNHLKPGKYLIRLFKQEETINYILIKN